VCFATEAVGQLSIDLYSGEPSTTSTCISLSIPDKVGVGQPLVFHVSASSGTINALTFEVKGDETLMFTVTNFNLNWINESYYLGLAHGTYEMTVIDWTDDPSCSLRVDHTFIVADPITELNASTLRDVAISSETEVELIAWVVGGSGVLVSTHWGDDTVSVSSCIDKHDRSVVIFNYTYEMEGTFTVSEAASNLISTITEKNQTISVYHLIQDLIVYGNSSALTPPGTGIWGVAAGTDQLPLHEDMICVWNMGTNYGDTAYNVPMLSSSTPHEITFSYGQEADVGTQTIHVNCSNPVSSQNLTMDVTVVWDNVTLGGLTCNSSTLWNHSITCELTVVRFGTGACFEWDMGDGKPPVYYQDGYCAGYVPAASPTYTQVFSFPAVVGKSESRFDLNRDLTAISDSI